MTRRPPWSWHGFVAATVAVFVSAGWAITLIAAALTPDPFTEAGINLLSTIGGVLAGGVAGYIGASLQASGRHRDDEPPDQAASSKPSSGSSGP